MSAGRLPAWRSFGAVPQGHCDSSHRPENHLSEAAGRRGLAVGRNSSPAQSELPVCLGSRHAVCASGYWQPCDWRRLNLAERQNLWLQPLRLINLRLSLSGRDLLGRQVRVIQQNQGYCINRTSSVGRGHRLTTRAGQTEERKPDSRGPDSAHLQFLAASYQAPSSPPATRTSPADPTRIQPRNQLRSACSAPGPLQYSMVKPAAKALPATSLPRTPLIGAMQASDGQWSHRSLGERRRQLEDVLDGVLQEISPRRHLLRRSRTISVEISSSVSPRGDRGHIEGSAAAGGGNGRRGLRKGRRLGPVKWRRTGRRQGES
jgi:hypothetical protein